MKLSIRITCLVCYERDAVDETRSYWDVTFAIKVRCAVGTPHTRRSLSEIKTCFHRHGKIQSTGAYFGAPEIQANDT